MKGLLIHYIDNHYGRGFLSEMQCITIGYCYARAHNLDFRVNDVRGPMYFSLGIDHYFAIDVCRSDDLIDTSGVLMTSCRPKDLPAIHAEPIGIWTMFDYLEKEVSPEQRYAWTHEVYTLNPDIQNMVDSRIQRAGLQRPYACAHIRRGDKELDGPEWGNTHHVEKYAEKALNNDTGFTSLFVCTDDFDVVRQMNTHLEATGTSLPVRSLTRQEAQGFNFQELYNNQKEFSEQDVLDLLTDLFIAVQSDCFIGTRSSNFFKVVKQLHQNPEQCLNVGF